MRNKVYLPTAEIFEQDRKGLVIPRHILNGTQYIQVHTCTVKEKLEHKRVSSVLEISYQIKINSLYVINI